MRSQWIATAVRHLRCPLAIVLVFACSGVARAEGGQPPTTDAAAQPVSPDRPSLEIYGFGQADAIVDFKQNNPDWYDVNRPSRLPNVANQFGQDGHFYLSPRQSRLGVKGEMPTANGVGERAVRVRHVRRRRRRRPDDDPPASRVGPVEAVRRRPDQQRSSWTSTSSRTSSTTGDRTGCSSSATCRCSGSRIATAIRMPASRSKRQAPAATPACLRIASSCRTSSRGSRRPTSPVTIAWRRSGATSRSAARCATSRYDDTLPTDKFDLSGHVWGWGVSVSSNVKATDSDVLRLQLVDGAGVENYFNDAPVDVGIKSNPGNAVTPVVGEALHDLGIVLYLDHTWNSTWSSAIGYSRVDISNSNGQAANAYTDGPVRVGQPALHAGEERDDGRRAPVGAPRQLSRTASQQRYPPAVLVQIQLLGQGGRLGPWSRRHVRARDRRDSSRQARSPSAPRV